MVTASSVVMDPCLTLRDRLRLLLQQGNTRAALKLGAASARYLGVYRVAIGRGWEALVRPELYRQMGHNPETLITEGLVALRSFLTVK